MNTQDGNPSDRTIRVDQRDQIWIEARDYNQRRAQIEQAKGMLMFVYGIDADDAFDALRSQSQAHNVKLQVIAEQVVKDFVELARSRGPARKPNFDSIVLAARNRFTNVVARQLNGESKTGVPMKDV